MAQINTLSVRETIKRASEEGFRITEYSLRKCIKDGLIPSRKIGTKVFLHYPNVVQFLTTGDEIRTPAIPARTSKILPCDLDC